MPSTNLNSPTNPFRFGALALDEAFADREEEVRELKADALNGQDVVIFAPRRYGKSSLVWAVMQELIAADVVVAYVNLMTTPTKEKLAEKLAATILEHVASPLAQAREKALAPFRGLRINPTITVDPEDATMSFSFAAGREPADIDATLERLLQLPAELGADQNRKVALIFDEFQEVVEVDPALPKLLRTTFEQQPEVARIYLGSKRHMMERIFNDENEPFWRSAKQVELGLIPIEPFHKFITARFRKTNKAVGEEVLGELLARTAAQPYSTQELAYALWEATPFDDEAGEVELEAALASVLRSEHAHFGLVWEQASTVQRLVLEALAEEPGRPLSGEYRRRHQLPAVASVQTALKTLTRRELVVRDAEGVNRIAEPFLAEWIVLNVGRTEPRRWPAPT
ncbi:ATP-binding protein [soil metagenome]